MPRIVHGTVVLVLLASVLAAGCTDPSGPARAEPVAASTAVDLAGEAADRWQADAQLVLLSGIEAGEGSTATREVPDEEGRSQPRAPSDPSIGDGRAPSWTALFYSPDANTTRSYKVVGHEVEDLGEATPPSSRPRVLKNWTVDSPSAVGTAMGNASFREAALAGDGEVLMTLGIHRDVPVWQLVARSPSQGAHVQLEVHASDGTIMEPEGRS